MMVQLNADLGRSQRARLTCIQCHRRKIKCDKNIPCQTCCKRGFADACTREDNSACQSPSAAAVIEDSELVTDSVHMLRRRVAELESELQHQVLKYRELIASHTGGLRNAVDVETATPLQDDESDAATVLEFLAWGRNKKVDITDAPEYQSGPIQHYSNQGRPEPATYLVEASTRAQLDFLESLMPSPSHVELLVCYHHDSLLWYHNSYSSEIFSDEFRTFKDKCTSMNHFEGLNFQWLALLFAIMAGSMTCAPPLTLEEWGFQDLEQPTLSLRWYEAAISCLNLSNYLEAHTIYSVQAIATLTISAHVIGKSNSQSVLLVAAGKIAQSLGLHRLGTDPPDMAIADRRKREAGRRLFAQLCTQDWFQIPFSESYNLDASFSHKIRPLNCNGEDMIDQPTSVPTQASYCNFRYEIAALMPQLLDASSKCNTSYTKYEQVLKFDDQMRKLATASIPTFLAKDAPIETQWPVYANWGRRSLTICAAHKVLMIHRKFISISFRNSAFAFTRQTCLAAAKTILKESLATKDGRGPVIWIEQAFSIAAAIIFGLDSAHRNPRETKYQEHRQLIIDTISYLQGFRHSKIASRGAQILASLQRELGKVSIDDSRKRQHDENSEGGRTEKRSWLLNMDSLVSGASRDFGVSPPATKSVEETSVAEERQIESFLDFLEPYSGFDGDYLWNN